MFLSQPGDGIVPHQDGPCYFPSVAILSIGSGCVLEFSRKVESNKPVFQFFLPPRSLMEFSGALYCDHLHSISFRHSDDLSHVEFVPKKVEEYRSDRYSFTFRHKYPCKWTRLVDLTYFPNTQSLSSILILAVALRFRGFNWTGKKRFPKRRTVKPNMHTTGSGAKLWLYVVKPSFR